MIRATAGVWVSYATTIAFQIVFALRLGAGSSASAFVIVFSALTSICGVLTSGTYSIVVPRLVAPDGALLRTPLRLLIGITFFGAALFGAIAAIAGPIAGALGPVVHLTSSDLVEPARLGALFGFLQIVAGELAAIAVARGRRFFPAVAPALPTLAAALELGLHAHAGVTAIFATMCVGSAAQVGLLLVPLFRGFRHATGGMPRIGWITTATIAQFVLLNAIPPLERVMASIGGASGAADYNYALRSLVIVQQLLIGGVVMAAIGDWSDLLRRARRHELGTALVKAGTATALLLVLAAAIAAVASRQLVALVYQHGAFTTGDSRAVATLLVIALPGFWAEGVALVLGQGLLAARRNRTAIAIGIAHFAVRAALVVAFAELWGVKGVAVSYSVSMAVVLGLEVVALKRLSLVGRGDFGPLAKGAWVALGTLAAALAVRLAGGSLPGIAGVGAVALVFAGLVLRIRPVQMRMVSRA